MAFLGSVLFLTGAAAADPQAFITRRGDKLFEGDREFRYVSVDVPDALQIITNYRFDGEGPDARYRLPNDFELRDAVATVEQLGGRVMRTFVVTCRPEPTPYAMYSMAGDDVVPNEAALRVLDHLLQLSHERGVRLLVPLVAYHSAIRGDVSTYGPDFWVVGSGANQRFKKMLRQFLNRRNTVTGVTYANDPAIFGWQTGNELVIGDAADRRAWLHDIAAYIKSIDSHHILIDGRNKPMDVHGKYEEFINDPNIDAVSYHTYVNLPEANTAVGTLRLIRAELRGRMPLLVTEVAMTTPPEKLKALLDEIIADGTVGAGWWAVRTHNRDGGFYKHSDRGSQFEDLNWPGFEARENVVPEIAREAELLRILGQYAEKIGGHPTHRAPAAPVFLPAPDAGHLSFQGATGASSYRIERAEAAAGPWSTVQDNYRDHLVVYAPLFSDETVVPGRSYWYRATARNAYGQSSPSAAVGPVAVRERWMIDDLFDLSRVQSSTNIRVETSYAHSEFQEDIGVARRLDDAKGASIRYRVPGRVKSCSAWVFRAAPAPRFFAVSETERKELPAKATPHGDGSRAVLSVDAGAMSVDTLEIEFPAEAPPGQAIGRIEISYVPRP